VAETNRVAVDVDELKVSSQLKSFLLADRSLGRLPGRRIRDPTAVVHEFDPAGQRFRDDAGSAPGGDATELDAAGQHEDIGCKAVPPLARRDPKHVRAAV